MPSCSAARGLVVLVEDVAHDLLDEVFQRDEAGDGAALVHDDRHVKPAAPHLAEQVLGTLELGHEDRGTQVTAHLEVFSSVSETSKRSFTWRMPTMSSVFCRKTG